MPCTRLFARAATPAAAILTALSLPAQEVAPGANRDPEYVKLRQAQPAVTSLVENIILKRDVGTFTLRQGTISFTPPVLGKVTIGVFIGSGEFSLQPAAALDKAYLKSIIGSETAADKFDRAVLCFTDATYEEVRRDAKAVALEPRAAGVLEDFRGRVRDRTEEPRSLLEAMLESESMDNIEAELLADLYNPKRSGSFSAYVFGGKYNDLRFLVKLRGAFPDLPSDDEVALLHPDPEAPDEGIWYLAPRSAPTAGPDVKQVVDAEHYRIETTLRGTRLESTAGVRLRAAGDGDRVIKFGLLPNLRVTKVAAAGADVAFIQEHRKADGSFYVVMPEPMAKDRTYELMISYQGDKVVHKAGGGNFSVRARTSWYPSINSFTDRATFELVFKSPKRYKLVSVGKPVSETREGDFLVTEWKSDIPLAVAGFNFGDFDRKEIKDEKTQYVIEGYATSDVPDYLRPQEFMQGMDETGFGELPRVTGAISPKALSESGMNQAMNSIRIFTHFFGPAPYGRIAITQQPEFAFGQSWPALTYIPLSAYLDSTQRWQLVGLNNRFTEFVQEVIPHEVAHQWWGHVVGWASYRDQWLSEGFADFSAGLFLQYADPSLKKYQKYWSRNRETILERNNFGMSANDAGPISLGLRLTTYKNPSAYSRVVYAKGGYVLHMLRWMMWDPKTGDQDFIRMMRDFVQANFNRNASTGDFKAAVEKYMKPPMNLDGNGKLDWFFNQWVHGTEIPRYKLTYDLAPADGGKWALTASLEQSEVSQNFKMPVPLYADFGGKIIRIGTVGMVGTTKLENIRATLPQKPLRVLINANYDVLEKM